jgi:large subunit ribosomal protein L4
MSKAIILDNSLVKKEEVALPSAFAEVNVHNLHLFNKAYLANIRVSSANVKTRNTIRGGGRKPFAQKGGGRSRQGTIRAVQYRGGYVVHGPSANRNFVQKINKKQQVLALNLALNNKADAEKLFIVDSVAVESGKTKDAAAMIKKLDQRDVLVVTENLNFADDKEMNTFLAFQNLKNAYLIEENEIDAYMVSTYHSVLMTKNVFDKLTKEG